MSVAIELKQTITPLSVMLQGLDKICKKHGISFMIDEVQTGGGSTGKMWCHEYFDIEPDIMTFSKKMISGGIYHRSTHRPQQPGRILNTWLGDAHKTLLLSEVRTDYTQSIHIINIVVYSMRILIRMGA